MSIKIAGLIAAIAMLPRTDPVADTAGHAEVERLFHAGGDLVGTPPVFIPPAVRTTPGPLLTPAATATAIVVSLNEATGFCRGLSDTAYVVDCLAERLDDVNRRMAGTSGYDKVRETLTVATRSLNQIAQDYRASGEPPTRFRATMPDGSQVTTNRRLVPVDPAQRAAALAQALEVIGEAETVLLRSAENSQDRAAQFQRIASAIGSNKVLLRS